MNVEDYACHIIQKYRLAVAIAVLRSKPEDISIDGYISNIREKLKEEDMEIEYISVNDFNLNDDENDLIINDIDDFKNNENTNSPNIDCSVSILKDDTDKIGFRKIDNSSMNPRETAYNESAQTQSRDIIHENNILEDDDMTFCDSLELNNQNNDNFDVNTQVTDEEISKNTILDSQNTIIYTLPDTFQTHISQSQEDILFIPQKYLRRKLKQNDAIVETQMFNNENSETDCNTDKNIEYNGTVENYGQDMMMEGDGELNKNHRTDKYINEKIKFSQSPLNNDKIYEYGNITSAGNDETSQFSMNLANDGQTESYKNEKKSSINISTATNIAAGEYVNKGIYFTVSCNNTQSVQEILKCSNTEAKESVASASYFDKNKIADDVEEEILDVTKSQAEIISFKVIEEYNRVKTFLNKRVEIKTSSDSHSNDSGYRSNSQSCSGNWLNQSAHCLSDYIVTCPLVTISQEITNRISHALGQLIDRLHEEEKYPSFLEKLLENVEILLKCVHQDCCEDLLQKDETITRLLLLNRSQHIIQYTIEKIINILEMSHDILVDNENSYEISRVVEIENLSYIFHILEILLKRYIIKKNNCSQPSSQTSREDLYPKMSSITHIWRKKWDPNYIEKVENVGSQRNCVLDKCCEVLNKIIVDSMDGYSLISYSALQCFNLLQS